MEQLVELYPNFVPALISGVIALFILLLIVLLPAIIFIINTIVLWTIKIKLFGWVGLLHVRTDPVINALSKLFATMTVLSLAFSAHEPFVYAVSIFIVATFITYPDFILRLSAIVFRNQKYFEFEFAKELMQMQMQNNAISQELERLRKENIELYFIAVYRDIYGSQLTILTILNANKGKYFEGALFRSIHKRTSYKDTYPFESYMGFLEDLKLIESSKESDEYKITQLGIEFLTYLSEKNLTLSRPTY